MPANQFGRYVWLVDTLRRYKHLSYKEINAKWQQSGLSYGEGDELLFALFTIIGKPFTTYLILPLNLTLM